MAYVNIPDTDRDAKSPLDESLFQTIDDDFNDHESRILALEAGSGSGGGSSDPSQDPRYGSILAGFQTNEAILWKRRYKPQQGVINNGEKLNNIEGFDPEGTDQSRWLNSDDNNVPAYYSDTLAYLGYYSSIIKSKSYSFKIKKGENFFGLGYLRAVGVCDQIRVYIDGASVSTTGLYNENGTTRADTFSSLDGAVSIYQKIEWFFGLDGEEHTITVFNDDSASKPFYLDFIEVGYASPKGEHAVDRDLKVKAGRVNVRGSVVSTAETDLTFDATSGYGRTDAIIADTSGTVSVLKGIEPAMTHCRPENIAFSGALTSIPVKNTYYFPTSGFLLVSHPNGGHYIASYTSKTSATPATHTFAGMLWQSKPYADYTPQSGFTSATPGDSKGDIMVNLWAGGGVEISSSNNKIDFSIIVNGVTTSHTATVASGLYSADLMPLSKAIITAMEAAKPLTSGSYFAEYNADSLRWTIGVRGSEISRIDFLFSTGSNAANSIRTAIGFTATDLTTKTSYLGQSNINSLAHRVFQQDASFILANDPRMQYNFADAGVDFAPIHYIEKRLGLGYVRTYTGDDGIIKIYPDDDACGISVSWLAQGSSTQVVAQIDYGQHYLIVNPDNEQDNILGSRTQLLTGFLSFPRGSHVIQLYMMSAQGFELGAGTNQLIFAGARQYFTKPKVESLTSSQSIIKCLDISPVQMWKTKYSADYSPQSTFDNIDTITRTGTWTLGTGWFNHVEYETSTQNDTLDVTFTLAGNGGGIGISTDFLNGVTNLVEFYLVSGATASEVSSLIQNHISESTFLNPAIGDERFQILGLSAGQYTLRMKNKENARMLYDGIVIYDTVMPDRGQTITDVTNTGQAVTSPCWGIYREFEKDSAVKTPNYLLRSGINEGKSWLYYQARVTTANYIMDDNSPVYEQNAYYCSNMIQNAADDIGLFAFCKSMFLYSPAWNGGGTSTTIQPVIDGVNHANTFATQVQTKGGSAPSGGSAVYNYYPLFSDHFERLANATMSNSTTFLMSNTKGMRVGQTVIVKRTGAGDLKRVIASVSAGVNVVFTEAISDFANYTTANNARVCAYNFHNIKYENDNENPFILSALCYEPLDIQPSNHEVRRMGNTKIGEVTSITFKGVATGADLYYPYFSDGRQATYLETSIDIIGNSTPGAYSFPYDLKNISIGAGTLDIKLTAVRRY